MCCKETKCCNCSKKHNITTCGKNMLHFKNSTDCMDKAPKIWKRRKNCFFPQLCRKTRLDQSQFERVKV
ncbi:hypothetical protein GO684_02275 [Wolbachia endosymbiont of Litomosoides brasiliensis]|uniref:hypothetical protein n=1 Tax=Wolbachia endosymbiont of Litomosoides brasiliensis TaxID=1812117 RepID=UPI00158C69DF|nr:hypothetical protein [Wolbachia endosymbiont of Litomosoides brasiliensis]NUY39511.1 hypothetical protein [Wolbachia endosymbiont of Litomosoides brasiliensis]